MVAANTAGNPLSAASLAGFMAACLPRNASPQLKNPYDAVALACHAGMLSVGFRLIGLGEDHQIETRSDAHDVQPLPTEWNASSTYAFRYAHDQSSMEYLVKVNRLGNKAIVFGTGLGDDKTSSFEVMIKDYISESSLPSTPYSTETELEEASKTLQDMFLTIGRLSDLGALLQLRIIQKLAPSIHKARIGETGEASTTTGQDAQRRSPPARGSDGPRYDPLREGPDPPPARPYPFDDPLAAPPRRPYPAGDFPPPGFEDEYDINRPPRGFPPGFMPPRIGEGDLNPPGLGPRDPLRPGGGGGMHPTFDDLMGGQGGLGYDPMAPPGARFDPVGPGQAPRDPRGGMRFPGGGGFGGPGGGNPFGGFGGGGFGGGGFI